MFDVAASVVQSNHAWPMQCSWRQQSYNSLLSSILHVTMVQVATGSGTAIESVMGICYCCCYSRYCYNSSNGSTAAATAATATANILRRRTTLL